MAAATRSVATTWGKLSGARAFARTPNTAYSAAWWRVSWFKRGLGRGVDALAPARDDAVPRQAGDVDDVAVARPVVLVPVQPELRGDPGGEPHRDADVDREVPVEAASTPAASISPGWCQRE